MRLDVLLLACVAACGSADSGPDSEPTEGGEDPISAMLDAADQEPDRESEPEELVIPADFVIVVTAGPVAVAFEERPLPRPTRIEARPDGSGEFDLVVMETWVEIGDRGRGPDTLFRAPLTVEDVRPLYRIFRERRSELEAPCIDHSVQDGSWRAINVRAEGVEHRFQCTNANTPAFDALADAFDVLVRAHTPAD